MKLERYHKASLLVVLASAVLSAISYPFLPATVPTHWNAAGEIDGYMAKQIAVLLAPGVLLALTLILSVLPAISPRGWGMASFARVWGILQLTILLFVFAVSSMTVVAGLGYHVPMDRMAFAGIGILVAVIGNYLGKLTRNFFVGIRTPWTLANEDVWERTHRLGGKVFVVAGLLMTALSFSGIAPAWPIAILVVAALIPVVYSFVVYRRIER